MRGKDCGMTVGGDDWKRLKNEGPRRSLGIIAVLLLLQATSPALALSEIKREEVPASETEDPDADRIEREDLPPPPSEEEPAEAETPPPPVTPPPVGVPVPLPDPIVIPQDSEPAEDDAAVPDEPTEAVPDILYDVELLPEPVKRMRQLIMEACLSGDVEKLRPLLGIANGTTQLSFGNTPDDPIAFLRELSGDGEGHEILAILYEVLAAGYVHLDAGEPHELYVWPYFFAVPLDSLDGRQRVELFKIVTAGDYEDMKNFGAYIFYRVGISPEGEWIFFVAGD